MVLYVVLISPTKVIDMKMISECPIAERGKLIIVLLVSELGVAEQRSDKEAAN